MFCFYSEINKTTSKSTIKMNKKKVIIIGGGISGLTAGIYLLDNNFDVTIYEKHSIPGGECTGWYRNNSYIDGCAHWIVGTNPKDKLYKLWEHIGAFDQNSVIYDMEYLSKFECGDKMYTLYSDIKKLKQELLSISKEDKRQINKLITLIKLFSYTTIPTHKPIDMMNIFELIAFGIRFLPMALAFRKYSRMSIQEFTRRFKSPVIRDILHRWMNKEYKMSSFLYVLQEANKNNAGVVKGGSLQMSKRITARFKELGGNIIYNSEVKKIVIENNIAKGIILGSDEKVEADYIIPSCDIHHTFYDLLDDKFTPDYFKKKFSALDKNPLNSAVYVSYKVLKDISNLPKMVDYKTEGLSFENMKLPHFQVRNYSFDETYIDKNGTLITIILPTNDKFYQIIKEKNKAEYNQMKNDIASTLKNILIEKMNLKENEIVLMDIATPLTYERYANAYHGSYMAFVSMPKSKGLMQKGEIKNLKNLIVAGQWLMPPGGLPIALFLGKHAAQRVCRLEKKVFINKEKDSNIYNVVKKKAV